MSYDWNYCKTHLQLDNLSKSVIPMEEGDLDMEHVRSIKDCVSGVKAIVAHLKKNRLEQ